MRHGNPAPHATMTSHRQNGHSADAFRLMYISWFAACLATVLTGAALQGVLMLSTLASFAIVFLAIFYGHWVWNKVQKMRRPFDDLFLFAAAFALRLVAIYILADIFTWHYGAPFFAMKDDFEYHNLAMGVYQDIPRGEYFNILYFIGPYYAGYPFLCGVLYYLFYPSTFTARIVNALIGSLIVVLIHRMGSYAFQDRRMAALPASIAVFLPSAVFYSSVQLKDIALSGMILAVLVCFYRFISGRSRWPDYVITVFCLLLMLLFRPAMPMLLMFVMFVFGLITFQRNRRVMMFSSALFVLFLLSWYFVGGKLLQSEQINPIGYIESKMDNAQTVPRRSALSDANVGLKALMAFPAFALGSPFVPTFLAVDLPTEDPLETRMRSGVYNKPSNFMMLVLAPFLFIGLVKAFLDRRENVYLMIAGGFWILHKLVLANSAFVLDIRQNTPSILVGLLFTALGFQAFREERYRKIGLAAFAISYAIMIAFNYVRLSARGLI